MGGTAMSFTESDYTKLCNQIKASEGCRLAAYACPAGALTVGYGHNCDAFPVPGVSRPGDRISDEQAKTLFENDLLLAVDAVWRSLPWAKTLTAPRQAVLYDMAFNMGLGQAGKSGLLSFVNTLALIESGRYAQAAKNMLQSKWARQVGGRAARLARQMSMGEWQ